LVMMVRERESERERERERERVCVLDRNRLPAEWVVSLGYKLVMMVGPKADR
jgi:hypothetical protein